MSIEVRNDCIGPCDPCICCGANQDYKVVVCDSCDMEIERDVYPIGGKHLCDECALGTLKRVDADDLCNEE